MKLATRLLIFALGLVTILGAVAILLTGTRLRERITRERSSELGRAAQLVGLQWSRTADAQAIAGAASAAVGGRVTLIDSNGIILGDASPNPEDVKVPGTAAVRPEVLQALSEQRSPANPAAVVENGELHVAVRVPAGVVRMAVSTDPTERIFAGLKYDAFLGLAVAAGWTLVFALVFARYVSRPVIQLRDMARGLAHREYTDSPVVEAPGEVGELAEALTQLSDRLEALERARSDFIANVSHELCSPLTIVNGFASTLVRHNPPDEERRQFANAILSNANRMQRVIDGMLDLSRIESGRWIPRIEKLDLSSVVHETLDSFRVAAAEKGLTLTSTVDERAPSMDADGTAARQTISNLLDNAIRHTSSGTITVASYRSTEGVWVEVGDMGEGIEPEHLPRVFERFYRVGDDRSRHSGGSGLGLSIVKHMADAHGGRVEIQSQPGKGTTIKVLFPQPPIPRRSLTPPRGSRQVHDDAATPR